MFSSRNLRTKVVATYKVVDANGQEVDVNPPAQPEKKKLETVNRNTLALKGLYLDKTMFHSYASAIEEAYLEANAGRLTAVFVVVG